MPRRRAPRVVNRAPGTDPASAVSSGVKTTAKSARPVRKDAKRDAKPKVIAAQPQAARWALDSSYVLANNAKGAQGCRRSRTIWCVRRRARSTRPASSRERRWPTPARFTGKAVTFMTVARFSTN